MPAVPAQPPAPPVQPPSRTGPHQPGSQGPPDPSSRPHHPLPHVWAEAIEKNNKKRGSQQPPSPATHLPATRRSLLSKLSLGLLGDDKDRSQERRLTDAITEPRFIGPSKVAVLSRKGGVGKTTTTIALGSVLASLRETRVIALDGNPDLGTLVDRIQLDTQLTMRDLVSDIESVRRYSDLRRYTSTNESRLQVLAGGNPAVNEDPYTTRSYSLTLGLLEQHYDLMLTDCGTGLRTPVMSSILQACDQVVIVLEPSQEMARMVEENLRELHACGHGGLASNALAVISNVTPTQRKTLDLERLIGSFRDQVFDVVEIPHDPHLALGGVVQISSMLPATRKSFMRLAASLVTRLSSIEENPPRPLTDANTVRLENDVPYASTGSPHHNSESRKD